MKKKNNRLRKNQQYNSLFAFMGLAFIIGIIIGSILIKNDSNFFGILDDVKTSFIQSKIDGSAIDSVLSMFYKNILVVIGIYLLGFAAISAPVIFCIIIYLGIGIGSAIGYFYNFGGITGMAFVFLILAVPLTFSSIAFVYIAKESMSFSYLLFYFLFGKGGEKIRTAVPALKVYSQKLLIVFYLLLLSGITDFLLTFLLAKIVPI